MDRIKAAVSGRTDPDFVIMARTDALANEGLEKAIARAKAYIEAGADMLFPEAITKLEDYRAFQTALSPPNFKCDVPILANITEVSVRREGTELAPDKRSSFAHCCSVVLRCVASSAKRLCTPLRSSVRAVCRWCSTRCPLSERWSGTTGLQRDMRTAVNLRTERRNSFLRALSIVSARCALQSKAALTVYEAIIKEGTQKSVVPLMQTRAELYE